MMHGPDACWTFLPGEKINKEVSSATSTIRNGMYVLGLMFLSSSVEAVLFDRGGGLVYDDVLDVTWLVDASYATTELTTTRVNEIIANNTLVFSDGHQLTGTDFFIVASGGTGDSGLMKWWGAMAWADQLEYFDPVRGITYNDWRLPTVNPVGSSFNTNFSNNGTTDHGYGATTADSEMAYMFYTNLGNKGYCTPNGDGVSTSCNAQTGRGLSNSGPFSNIHTQTYWSNTELGVEVWAFDFGVGYQGLKTQSNRNNQLRAWAVRDGDVVVAPAADGDLNFDGQVNAADIIIGLRILSGDITPTGQQMLRGDVAPFIGGVSVPDGFIRLNDIAAIQRKALGLASFP